MTTNPFGRERSAHWYAQDGTPQHDANLRTARKENLFYSVTTILKMWPREVLDAWKQKNIVEKCIENPMFEGESKENYVERIAAVAARELNAAASWGRTIHAMFEEFAASGTFPQVAEEFEPYKEKISEWFATNVNRVIASEVICVNNTIGYAGQCDLIIDSKEWGIAVCDFKRRGFYKGKPNVYDTDPMQLEAYSRCLDYKTDSLVSVGVNRDAPEIMSHVWKPEQRETFWKKFMLCHQMTCLSKNYAPAIQFELPCVTQAT